MPIQWCSHLGQVLQEGCRKAINIYIDTHTYIPINILFYVCSHRSDIRQKKKKRRRKKKKKGEKKKKERK